MKRLQLTTWERVTLLGCFPQMCPLVEMPQHLKVVEILRLDGDEEKLVGYTRFQGPDGLERKTWTNTKLLFDIELSKPDFRLLMRLVKKRVQWPRLQESLVLNEKLEDAEAQPTKVEEEEEE